MSVGGKMKAWMAVAAILAVQNVLALMPLDECREKAGYGNAEALFEMGQRYEEGNGVRKDPLRAISYYRKSADKKHAPACRRMSAIYGSGLYVSKDPAKAAYYENLAGGISEDAPGGSLGDGSRISRTEADSSEGDDVNVAVMRILGKNGYTKDVASGTVMLFTAAKNGNREAQRKFVEWFDDGLLDPEFKTNDDGWRRISAWRVAAFEAGNRLLGLGIGRQFLKDGNMVRALHYFELAGSAGSSEAALEAGYLYYAAKEPNTNRPARFCSDNKAIRWFKRAVEAAKDVEDKNQGKIGLVKVYCTSSVYRNTPEALKIAREVVESDRKNVFYNYVYGSAGMINTRDAWRRLGLRETDRTFRTELEKFRARLSDFRLIVSRAVNAGQKDIWGMLSDD